VPQLSMRQIFLLDTGTFRITQVFKKSLKIFNVTPATNICVLVKMLGTF
jgi:hypothetical protein